MAICHCLYAQPTVIANGVLIFSTNMTVANLFGLRILPRCDDFIALHWACSQQAEYSSAVPLDGTRPSLGRVMIAIAEQPTRANLLRCCELDVTGGRPQESSFGGAVMDQRVEKPRQLRRGRQLCVANHGRSTGVFKVDVRQSKKPGVYSYDPLSD